MSASSYSSSRGGRPDGAKEPTPTSTRGHCYQRDFKEAGIRSYSGFDASRDLHARRIRHEGFSNTEKQWYLNDIVAELRQSYPEVEFHCHFDTSSIRPDGGILYIKGGPDDKFTYPILIAEVKNQGTNELRAGEGLPKQAKGNAIERLEKNLIRLRAALMRASIFPFVCFGYGCEFESDSSILDRVSTMAMFGKLNTTHLHSEEGGKFSRGSSYFRPERWSVGEMVAVMKDTAERPILYYGSSPESVGELRTLW